MMSEAVTVPPGVLMRNTRARTWRSCAAFLSSSRIRTSIGTCTVEGPRPRPPDGASSVMKPETSINRIFASPLPSTTSSSSGRTGGVRSTESTEQPVSVTSATRSTVTRSMAASILALHEPLHRRRSPGRSPSAQPHPPHAGGVLSVPGRRHGLRRLPQVRKPPAGGRVQDPGRPQQAADPQRRRAPPRRRRLLVGQPRAGGGPGRADDGDDRSEEHTSELQSPCNLVCRLLLEKKNKT